MIFDFQIVKGITIGSLIIVILLFILVIFLSKFLSLKFNKIFKEKISKDQLKILSRIINYSIISIYIITSLNLIGVNLSGLLVAGGVAGIVIGLASQKIIGNLISGIFLIIDRPIKIGSTVLIENIVGEVVDILLLTTYIKSFDGLLVRLPNEKVFSATITNYSNSIVRRVDYMLYPDYECDLNNVIALIKDVLDENPYILVNPEYDIFLDKTTYLSYELAVRFWTPTQMWFIMKKSVLSDIDNKLKSAGIKYYSQKNIVLADQK